MGPENSLYCFSDQLPPCAQAPCTGRLRREQPFYGSSAPGGGADTLSTPDEGAPYTDRPRPRPSSWPLCSSSPPGGPHCPVEPEQDRGPGQAGVGPGRRNCRPLPAGLDPAWGGRGSSGRPVGPGALVSQRAVSAVMGPSARSSLIRRVSAAKARVANAQRPVLALPMGSGSRPAASASVPEMQPHSGSGAEEPAGKGLSRPVP